MSTINAVLRSLLGLLNRPLEGLSPFWGVLIWSIPVAIFALVVFKWSSNQEQITAVKKRIFACLFEIRLFNDDLRAILRAQWEIFRHVLTYQRYSLAPMVWILPPLLLLMVHLHGYYGYRALQPGETALLKVQLSENWAEHEAASGAGSRPPLSLELPAGLEAETPAVWMHALNEMAWRLAARETGEHELTLRFGETSFSKSLAVSDRTIGLGYERPSAASFFGQLEWPTEQPLPGSAPIESIVVTYPAGSIGIFGLDFEWEFAWMVVFFVWTMVIAFALRKRMGVEF